jgi:plastocyanin
MRRITVLLIALVSLCIAAPPAGAGVVCARTISIDNSQYSPEIAGKAARSTVFVVCWANEEGVNHTASSNSGLFDTDTIPPGTGGGGTFYGAGKYPYHCEIHPFMAGTFSGWSPARIVVVRAPSANLPMAP